eukprot:NODE_3566_length_2017_cov_15.250794.p1 GENE.NODE_3566_length_2017_cov_15.250794~~NODE_3566_length_2017_cov_15.250794.p1  ORF type:complete len:599 (-),score=92.47 NODE_3566_length_2017_cov_15.250794:204-2000(-)
MAFGWLPRPFDINQLTPIPAVQTLNATALAAPAHSTMPSLAGCMKPEVPGAVPPHAEEDTSQPFARNVAPAVFPNSPPTVWRPHKECASEELLRELLAHQRVLASDIARILEAQTTRIEQAFSPGGHEACGCTGRRSADNDVEIDSNDEGEDKSSFDSDQSRMMRGSQHDRISSLMRDDQFNRRSPTGTPNRTTRRHSTSQLSAWRVVQKRSWAENMVSHVFFERGVAILIMANVVLLAADAEYRMQHLGDWLTSATPAIRALELFFLSAFALELAVRIAAQGQHFFDIHGLDVLWNMFDSCMMALACLEELVQIVPGQPLSIASLRCLRLLRLVRVARLLRVIRLFAAFRILITGIFASTKTMVWCVLIIAILQVVFGIAMMQVLSNNLSDAGSSESEFIQSYFGSLPRTLYVLHACTISGWDWADVSEPLLSYNSLAAGIFVFYISFSMLCILNLITGIYVDGAKKMMQSDTDHVVLEDIKEREEWATQVANIFENADLSKNGGLTLNEFENYLQDKTVQAYCRRVGLNVEPANAVSLFAMLDFDDDGVLTIDEFIQGCRHVVGTARQLDVMRMHHQLASALGLLREIHSNSHELA